MDTVNTELIRGHVDTIILNAIMERDRYGYEILDIISNLSDGRYEIKQPTLYSCLKRLEKQGFITSYYGDESNGGRRRYYRITDKGRETVEQDQREWEFSRTIINRLLSDKEIDLATVEAPFDTSELRPLTRRVRVYEDDTPIAPTVTESVPHTGITTAPVAQVTNDPNPVDQTTTSNDDKAEITEKSAQTDETEAKSNYSQEEALAIKEKQTAASKLLQIGEFAQRINLLTRDESPSENITQSAPTPSSVTVEYHNDVIKNNAYAVNDANSALNYREALSAIYVTKDNAPPIKSLGEAEVIDDESATKTKHFAEVKQSLYEDGYKLKVYQKANSANYYYMKYIYSNRINRDTAIFTYLILLVELLVMIIAHKSFGSATAYIVMAVAGLAIPIVPTLIWAGNPTKRVKAKFNPSSSLINALIVFIIISAIAIILSLVVNSLNVDFTKGSAYVPYILASNIPISVLIYGLLYKSNNYHLKK